MNTRRNFNIKLSALAVMTALAIPLGNATAADPMVLRSGNVDSFAQSYGRAGGLVGSDRVMALQGTTANSHPCMVLQLFSTSLGYESSWGGETSENICHLSMDSRQ